MSAAAEKLVPLAEAASLFPAGVLVTAKSLHRWASHGVGGVRLETLRCGGRVYTSPADVREFLGRLNGGR